MANFFDGKVIPNSPQGSDEGRYQNLGLKDAEPNLGIPEDDGYVLSSDVLGNRSWVPSGMGPSTPFIPKSLINAKGDIIIGSSDDTPTVISVAPDGSVLITDSSDFVGVKWIDFSQLGLPLSLFGSKGDVVVGISGGAVQILPVGNDGEALVADSAEPLGVKWSIPKGIIETTSIDTDFLLSGQSWDFWLDLGQLSSFLSLSVSSPSEDGWLRVYTSGAARLADTRVAPGPPLPSPNSGFVTEVVTTPSETTVALLPIPQIYSESGVYFRFTNLSLTAQTFSLEIKFYRSV